MEKGINDMSVCGKCLYNKNCQFLAKYKIEPDGCSAFRSAEDFVEVVRCRNCIHLFSIIFGSYCQLLGKQMDKDDYCSYGERRKDNEID